MGPVVGSVEGFLVGNFVGLPLSSVPAVELGSVVGLLPFLSMRPLPTLEASVGEPEGFNDGDKVGALVDGSTKGDIDKSLADCMVGTSDGALDGASVGETVGLLLPPAGDDAGSAVELLPSLSVGP